MKLPLIISALILVAGGAVYLAPEPKIDVVVPIEFSPPPLQLEPDFMLPPMRVDCDAYFTDPWTEQKAMQRCSRKI